MTSPEHDGPDDDGHPNDDVQNRGPENETTPQEIALFVGLLIGEGHFGGDGRQPQITLRMHTRHESLFFWVRDRFPGGKLYGPYNHGGRSYYQWMARGKYLRDELVPLLDQWMSPQLDGWSHARFVKMKRTYHIS